MSSNNASSSSSHSSGTEQGIASLLAPVVLDMDKAINATQQSQDELGKEIERLVAELELFTDIAEPPRLQPALNKLTDSRKRLAFANKLMQQTQARVQRIESQLSSPPPTPSQQ